MDEYKRANQELWDNWTLIHERSSSYDVEGFRAGKCSLKSIELEELGDVASKSLLHLQCHFGLDTLSWARRGARVTGVDFSQKAIVLARALADECGLEASFICSDIYELDGLPANQFDVVYTSYGVLAWLPDLSRWARIAARYLKPGGTFYMVEFHPFAGVFDDAEGIHELRVAYPYFASSEPLRFEGQGSYAEPNADYRAVSYEWLHTMGGVLNALIQAGLRLEFLHEFPFSAYKQLPFLEQGEDGWWRSKEQATAIPLMFSLRATG